jgi:hypothetical protein
MCFKSGTAPQPIQNYSQTNENNRINSLPVPRTIIRGLVPIVLSESLISLNHW